MGYRLLISAGRPQKGPKLRPQCRCRKTGRSDIKRLPSMQINRRNSNPEAQCVVELDWRLIPSRTAYQSPQLLKQTEIPDANLIAA
jgi:hypothetical protein